MDTYTDPVTVHRTDHTGRGVQQGPQYGCVAVAVAVAERLKRADRPGRLNPKPSWYVAARVPGTGRYDITYIW